MQYHPTNTNSLVRAHSVAVDWLIYGPVSITPGVDNIYQSDKRGTATLLTWSVPCFPYRMNCALALVLAATTRTVLCLEEGAFASGGTFYGGHRRL